MSYRYVLCMSVGLSGCDGYEFYESDVELSEDYLNAIAWEAAVEHASSYGEVVDDSTPEEDIDALEEDGYTVIHTYQIEGWFEKYDPEKHDGLAYGPNGPVFQPL